MSRKELVEACLGAICECNEGLFVDGTVERLKAKLEGKASPAWMLTDTHGVILGTYMTRAAAEEALGAMAVEIDGFISLHYRPGG